jgi:drug/metabolite transporter (DMT)-like permease
VRDQEKGRMYVALAAVAWSTAGAVQRELSVGTATQVAGRAVFAALALAVYVIGVERGGTLRAFRVIGLTGLVMAVLLAVSSGAFIAALNHTTVANVLFMQALAPVLAAVLGTFVGDPVARRTWVALAIAVVGVGVMVGGPGHASASGQALTVVMSAAFAGMLVITRHRREVSMAPAIVLSQVLLVLVFGPFSAPGSASGHDIFLLALLGVTQIGLGAVFLTIGGRLIPAGEVALITLLEVVLGPLWVWLVVSERPSNTTLAGGAIVLVAVLLEARVQPASAQPAA